MKRYTVLLLVLVLLSALTVRAQDMATPSIEVSDQVSLDGTVTITSAYSDGPGWAVIHVDGGGQPGPVIGQSHLHAGWNYNVKVAIDAAQATPTLYAMLHTDAGEVQTYEFPGADVPVSVDGQVVTPAFKVDLINAADQLRSGSTVMADSVTAQAAGWLVIHADDGGKPGPVLGQTQVNDGANANVKVELSGDITPVLWPMLHVDAGTVGTYEFPGDDAPATDAAGNVVTFPVSVAPSIVYEGGIADGVITVNSALIDMPGWLVIHADDSGKPGAVLGQAPVLHGANNNIQITVDPAAAGTQVFPMLHYDLGEAGVYEFPGADAPVAFRGNVVTGPLSLGQ